MIEFHVGHRVVITHGEFRTLEATIVALGENPRTAEGSIDAFGRALRVKLSAGAGSRVKAVADHSKKKYSIATPVHGTVGRIESGTRAGSYIRIDTMHDLAETPKERAEAAGVLIRVAADPDMQIDCIQEWAADWIAVEEALERDGRRVDWQWAGAETSTSQPDASAGAEFEHWSCYTGVWRDIRGRRVFDEDGGRIDYLEDAIQPVQKSFGAPDSAAPAASAPDQPETDTDTHNGI